MAKKLYLGSKSPSRQLLLQEIQLPFTVVGQDADETKCDWALPLPQVVASIARYKMDHVVLPAGSEGEICFVLTADTLSQDPNGDLQGKAVDRDDAIAKLKAARGVSYVGTAFCLDKKIWRNGAWSLEQRIERYVQAAYVFDVPDKWIETYLEKSMGLNTAGAIAVEGFGLQFLKMVNGSFSTIVGLPLFELREALEELGFF